ncbi:site-specific DNA-methyltransferase [candidate division TA06 bacterium]|uniref:Methyltransferase n=1 Tax=candidate division TA06 bacterium TaxID=2250710 RepID=A0A933MJ25_UNCT6|nr:site-specific DNA-methyltransferase [candidate division TA06 bacterium]
MTIAPAKIITNNTPNILRLPVDLQNRLSILYRKPDNNSQREYLKPNSIYHGDSRLAISSIEPNSIALSIWSPPYFVGKEYEAGLSFDDWQSLIRTVIKEHFSVIIPGGFLAINIADILCFKDASMPRLQADVVSRKNSPITKEDVLQAIKKHPNYKRQQLAQLLRCSEQTVDRRLNGNNIRGGKHKPQTRVKIVGGLIEEWALSAGFYPYDRRVWVKDAAWRNSRWASLSYRSVDEFEYLYIFWKPGITRYDRNRLTNNEWKDWGSRGVWKFPSVRINDIHEAMFPIELPQRAIRLLTDSGDTVLDPFMGSGTTAIAAMRTNRNYIGIEFQKKAVETALKRILKEREENGNRPPLFDR